MRMATRALGRTAATAVVLLLALGALLGAAGNASAQSWSGTWTAKSLANPPGGRGWVDLIFDEVLGRSVLFGGSGSEYNNDIQQFNLVANTWTQAEPTVPCWAINWHVPPTPRDEHAVEYDSVQRLYWTFGGSGFGCKGNTLGADAGTTTSVVVDAALSATAVDHYKYWWVELSASGGKALVTAYDPATKRLTLQTPIAGLGSGASYLLYPQRGGGTYYYNPATRVWTGLGLPFGYTGPLPAHRFSPAMAYSPADQVIVMFGGDSAGFVNDTWVIDTVGKRWVMKKSNGAPGSPPGMVQVTNSMVYDSVNDVFVFFGGRCPSGAPGVGCSSNQTWVYHYPTNTWTNRSPATRPPAREQHTMVFDRHNGVTVLFGGSNGGTELNDTWVYHYPTNTWSPVSTPTSPPARRLGGMAYDSANHATVLYSGVAGGGSLIARWDLWALTLVGSSSPNPVPVLSAISPTSAAAGGPGFTLTLTGSSFAPNAVVRWNGAARTTFFDGATQLRATITAADIAAAGTASVTVFNPAPGGGTSASKTFTVTGGSPPPPGEIVIDNAPVGTADASRSFTGTWCVSAAPSPLGPDSLFSCGGGIDTYRWTPSLSAGSYDVYVRWTQHPNRSTAVPIAVQHAGGLATRTFNEQTGGASWVLHGRYTFNAGTGGFVQVSSSAGQAAADAVRFVPAPAGTPTEIVIDNAPLGASDASRTFTGTWCLSAAPNPLGADSLFSCGGSPDTYRWRPTITATGQYDVYVRWTQHPNRSTAVPISVTHAGGTTTRTFNEQTGGATWVLHGRYTFNAGTGGFVQVNGSAGQAAADAVRFVPVP